MAELKIKARELTGAHIGHTLRYLVDIADCSVEAIYTGILSGVHHWKGGVRITLNDKFDKGLHEEVLPADKIVVITPDRTKVESIRDLRE